MAPQWQVALTLVDIWQILLYALYNQKVSGSGDIEHVALEVEDKSVRHGGVTILQRSGEHLARSQLTM